MSTKWMLWMVMAILACLTLVPNAQGARNVSALTDTATSKLEGRVGFDLANPVWEVGGLATWFAQEESAPWGVGAYVKLDVDPNASIPIANWIPKLGTWLNLPESMPATGYLIGKGEILPYEDNVDFSLGVGAGLQIGPVIAEAVYDIVESGDADNPAESGGVMVSSGFEVWLGMRIEF